MQRYDIDSLENRDPVRFADFVPLVERFLVPYFRSEVRGLDRVTPGAALYVANHSGGLLTPDTFLFSAAVFRALGMADMPYGLTGQSAIALPLVHQLLVPLGAVRASHANARGLFARGNKVLVYPGGEFDVMRTYRDRNRIVFGGRVGYIRLALREGVPIIPVVSAGAHETFCVLDSGLWLARLLHTDRLLRMKAWPIALCLPWGLTIGPGFYFPWRTRILIEALPPITFERHGEAAAADEAYVRECADRVEAAMQAALGRLTQEREASAQRRKAA